MQLGEYYLNLLTHLIRCHVELDSFKADLASNKTVEFGELNLKWPTIKPVEG